MANGGLGDIFGSQPVPTAQPAPAGGFDIFGGAPTPVPAAPQENYFNAFEDSNVKIEFTLKRNNSNEHTIKAWFSNISFGSLSNLSLQVAVQKYMKLTLHQISSTDLPPSSSR